ncbi:MAG: NAD-binding protein, partial [Thiotrichales bacterium]|nr:NAD-binding protein [Thiotrichales bacterium]
IFSAKNENDDISDSALLENASGSDKNHILICGYGAVGQKVARTLEEKGMPFLALDISPDIIRNTWSHDEPVYFGDATKSQILASAGLARARAVVICVESDETSWKILQQIRKTHIDLPVIINTHDIQGHENMIDSGASMVISETQAAARKISDRLQNIYNND